MHSVTKKLFDEQERVILIYDSMVQFAGGFDAETMHAFEELRNIAHLFNKK